MAMQRTRVKRKKRHEAAAQRVRNEARKTRERQRRDERMRQKIGNGTLPFTPPVMSWLSGKLHKKAGQVTPEDLRKLAG